VTPEELWKNVVSFLLIYKDLYIDYFQYGPAAYERETWIRGFISIAAGLVRDCEKLRAPPRHLRSATRGEMSMTGRQAKDLAKVLFNYVHTLIVAKKKQLITAKDFARRIVWVSKRLGIRHPDRLIKAAGEKTSGTESVYDHALKIVSSGMGYSSSKLRRFLGKNPFYKDQRRLALSRRE
jgi:hypothetical protein